MSKNVARRKPVRSAKLRSDRRVVRTRARLGQALRTLMEERSLEKISVQDVIELAGVSRSAFYVHYDDKIDLLLSDMDEFLERMAMLLFVRNERSNRIAPVREFFSHVGEAAEIRGALARSDRLHDFYDLAREHIARGIEVRLKQITERERAHRLNVSSSQPCQSGADVIDSSSLLPLRQQSLVAQALAGAFISLLNAWVRKGQRQSPEAMDNLFHDFAWTGLNRPPMRNL